MDISNEGIRNLTNNENNLLTCSNRSRICVIRKVGNSFPSRHICDLAFAPYSFFINHTLSPKLLHLLFPLYADGRLHVAYDDNLMSSRSVVFLHLFLSVLSSSTTASLYSNTYSKYHDSPTCE